MSIKKYKGLHLCKNSLVINSELLKVSCTKFSQHFSHLLSICPICYTDIFLLLLPSTVLSVFQGSFISLQWFIIVEGVATHLLIISFQWEIDCSSSMLLLILSRAVLPSVCFCLKFL